MSDETRELTIEEIASLKIAGELIDAGIPVFAAAPNPDRPGHYFLPRAWQQTPAHDRRALEQWRPGWALAAVGGHAADFIDFDPRNGGTESEKELRLQGQMPRAYGVQSTPSGGTHLIITPTGERKATGFMPGVDLQAGAAQADEQGSHGRGFVYIAPTIRPSKAPETLGQLRPYVWTQAPDMPYLQEFSGADDTLDGLLARVHAARTAAGTTERPSVPATGVSQLFMQPSQAAGREFTRAEAEAFCLPHLQALERAQIGEIEEHANRAAAALSHFVPALWSADEAYAVLLVSLSATAYDPSHPASGWTAEKFRPVLDGRRAPLDGWKAARRVTPEEAAASFGAPVQQPVGLPATAEQADGMVEALLAEMLTPEQVESRPPPKALIKGLLNLDSCAWVIGAPGSKKSFVVLDQAAHVVQGKPWQGLKVHQGLVVMIVAEGAGGMSNRIKAYQQKHGPIGAQMRILPRPVQVSDVAAWQVLVEACRRLQPVMVVIDTQARVTVGLEENSAKEMGIFVEAAERIRQATGACVVPVHHTGRQGGDARGSSAIDGAQVTELKVIKQDALTGVLRTEKQKDLEERPDMPLYFERVVIGVDEDGEEVTSLVLLEKNAFKDAEGRTPLPEDWALNWPTVSARILTVLVDQGGEIGLTKAEARTNVAARWYLGKVVKTLGSDAGALTHSTFDTAWSKVLAASTPDGDPIVTNPRGEKWIVDQVAREAWAKRPE